MIKFPARNTVASCRCSMLSLMVSVLSVSMSLKSVPIGSSFVMPSSSAVAVQRISSSTTGSTTQQHPSVLYNSAAPGNGSSGNNGRDLQTPRLGDLPGPQDTTEDNIRSLFALFNNALATGVPKIVAKRYAKDAVLLPSSNGDPIMDSEGIEEFYTEYLNQKPQKRILESTIRVGYGWAEDVGLCEITLRDPVSGIQRKIKARYSMVYVWEGHQWKILHHHSSILGAVEAKPMPAPSVSAGPMTTDRVQNLFQLLQDAIDTGDSDAVARRFTVDGLLLPLEVYEQPKRGYDEIRDYMDEFLIGRPEVSKVERIQVSVDPATPGHQTWAKDVGVLELTFKKDGSKLNARYSIDYVLDNDGVWKVFHFQLSPLPQDWAQLRRSWMPSMVVRGAETSYSTPSVGIEDPNPPYTPPRVTEDQVRGWFIEWNTAMATGDPKVVLNRYATDAVMMTTMSQRPKTTPQEIAQFYQMFLWNRPQAAQLESHVTLSSHWAKDIGVLEYTLTKSDGQVQKVRERYSFLYTFDEVAGWRIAHHHASVMPGVLTNSGGGIHETHDVSQHFQ